MAEKEKLGPLANGFVWMEASYDFRFSHLSGHAVNFEKGKPTPVPPQCQAEALQRGASVCEGAGAAQVKKDYKPEAMKDPGSPEYRASVQIAAENLLSLNRTEDFGANGKPLMEAWERELGFRPAREVRDPIWSEVRDGARQ